MRRVLLGSALFLAAAGCSGGGGTSIDDGRVDELRAGGWVEYCSDSDVNLAGVAVTLTSFDGDVLTATTNPAGVWQADEIPEGIYSIDYSLAGYSPRVESAVISQAEGSPSAFVELGGTCLFETPTTVTIFPFGVTLTAGQTLVDGVDGQTLVYSISGDTYIEATFDRPFYPYSPGGAYGVVRDGATGAQMFGADYSNSHDTLDFTEPNLDIVNGLMGGTLTTGGVLHYLRFEGVIQYDPINAGQHSFIGGLRFRAVP